MAPTLVHWGWCANCRWAFMAGCLHCLRWTLVASCLEERKSHPQDKDHSTRESERHMKVKKAITQVAAGAAKRLTKWLIRRSGGWLHTHYLVL